MIGKRKEGRKAGAPRRRSNSLDVFRTPGPLAAFLDPAFSSVSLTHRLFALDQLLELLEGEGSVVHRGIPLRRAWFPVEESVRGRPPGRAAGSGQGRLLFELGRLESSPEPDSARGPGRQGRSGSQALYLRAFRRCFKTLPFLKQNRSPTKMSGRVRRAFVEPTFSPSKG